MSASPASPPAAPVRNLARKQVRLLGCYARLLSRLAHGLRWEGLDEAERERLAHILARLDSDLALARLAVRQDARSPAWVSQRLGTGAGGPDTARAAPAKE